MHFILSFFFFVFCREKLLNFSREPIFCKEAGVSLLYIYLHVWFALRCLISAALVRIVRGSDHWTAQQMTCQRGASSVNPRCLVPLLVCLASHTVAVDRASIYMMSMSQPTDRQNSTAPAPHAYRAVWTHSCDWLMSKQSPTRGAFLWLAKPREISDWLLIIPCLKKGICVSSQVKGVSKFTHKCSEVHRPQAVCKSIYICVCIRNTRLNLALCISESWVHL